MKIDKEIGILCYSTAVNRIFVALIVLMQVSFLHISNGNSQEKTFTIKTIDGVKNIHNKSPLNAEQSKIKIEFVRKIGILEGENENLMFFRPTDIARNDSGNYFILDSGNFRIQEFDRNLNFIRSFGSRGKGPGEFEYAHNLEIAPDQSIHVFEFNIGKFIKYAPDGVYLSNIDPNIRRIGYRFKINSSGNYIITTKIATFDAGQFMMRTVDSQGKAINEFCQTLKFDNSKNLSNAFLRSRFLALDSMDNIYVVFGFQNRIEKFTKDGAIIFTCDRSLNFEIKYAFEETILKLRGREMKTKMPNYTIVSFGCGVDHKDRLWTYTAKEHTTTENTFDSKYFELEIYSREGVLLQKLPVPDIKIEYIKFIGDRVYFMDCTETMSVYEYKIIDLDI